MTEKYYDNEGFYRADYDDNYDPNRPRRSFKKTKIKPENYDDIIYKEDDDDDLRGDNDDRR